MSFEEYLSRKQKLQDEILKYVDQEIDEEENYQNIVQLIKDQNIETDVNEFRSILHLINHIYNHHNRSNKFYQKIESILILLKSSFSDLLTSYEIFNIFIQNKRIILFLITNDLIKLEDNIIDSILNDQSQKLPQYFANLISNYVTDENISQITKESQGIDINSEEFINNQHIGESEKEICQLIRNDSIDEFISFMSQSEASLNSKIKPSIFETNLFIENKFLTLIQYASFFGSIQIFKYLYKNGVELNSSLWLYAIHGRNPEIISILEEEKIQPEKENFNECVKEAIKCHHNEIVDYFYKNNFNIQKDDKSFFIVALKYYNFQFIEKSKIMDSSLFIYLCFYDHFYFVDYFLKNKNFDINTIFKVNLDDSLYITTPLTGSIEYNNSTISELLLKIPNIDVNIKSTHDNQTSGPLISAFMSNNIKIFKLLLENKQIDVNATYYYRDYFDNDENEYAERSVLFSALIDNNTDILNLLLSHPKIDVNLPRIIINNSLTLKMTPLHYAISENLVEIIEILLLHPNINVNLTTDISYKNTYPHFENRIYPIIEAISIGNLDIISLLVSHPNFDADINYKYQSQIDRNFYNINPLIYAVCLAKLKIVEFLIKCGKFDINRKGSSKYNDCKEEVSALSLAVELCNYDIVKVLLSQPDINVNDLLLIERFDKKKNLKIPLLYRAIKAGNEDIVDLFLENPNIDVNNYKFISSFDESESSKYPILHLAILRSNINIIKKLLSKKEINININSFTTIRKDDSIITKEISTIKTAISRQNIDILNLLLSNESIDLNKKSISESNENEKIDKKEESIMETAILTGDIQIITILLSQPNLDINMKSKRTHISQDFFFVEKNTILQLAISSEDINIITCLCKILRDKISLSDKRLNELMNMTKNDEIKSILYNNFSK